MCIFLYPTGLVLRIGEAEEAFEGVRVNHIDFVVVLQQPKIMAAHDRNVMAFAWVQPYMNHNGVQIIDTVRTITVFGGVKEAKLQRMYNTVHQLG